MSKLSATGGSRYHVKIACPCIDRNDVPFTDWKKLSRYFIAWVQTEPLFTYGMKIADAYNLIIRECLERKMTHVVLIESDMIVPVSAVDRLLTRCIVEGHPYVCGSYVFKNDSDISVAVTDFEECSQRIPEPFVRRGLVPVRRALPLGCAIIDLQAVKNLPQPMFMTTEVGKEPVSQDCYFTTLMCLYGHTPFLDTDIQCIHVSREDRLCYGTPEYVSGHKLRQEKKKELAVRDDF